MAARSPLSTSPGLGGGSGGALTGRAAPFPFPLPTAAEAAWAAAAWALSSWIDEQAHELGQARKSW